MASFLAISVAFSMLLFHTSILIHALESSSEKVAHPKSNYSQSLQFWPSQLNSGSKCFKVTLFPEMV